MDEKRLEDLEVLVEEMTKHQPDEEFIKLYMKKTNISYVQDPIERINAVLDELQAETPPEVQL